MEQVLVIKSDDNSFEKYVMNQIESCGCSVFQISKISPRYGFPLDRVTIFFRILSYRIYFRRFSKIIVFGDYRMIPALALLFRKKSDIKLWLWNTAKCTNRLKLLKHICDIWTFDEGDAKRYGFYWNSQFYFYPTDANDVRTISSLFFIGEDKNRFAIITKLSDYLKENSIAYDIRIKKDKSRNYPEAYSEILCDEPIEYDKIINSVRGSKAVLDITKPEQSGLTFRVMEAIFHDRKIVTNNVTVTSTSFYDRDKVFFIDGGKYDGLADFLRGENVVYSKETKEYYSFSEWLKRML